MMTPWLNWSIDVAKEVVGEDDVVDDVPAPNMAGEDFAYYLEKYQEHFSS